MGGGGGGLGCHQRAGRRGRGDLGAIGQFGDTALIGLHRGRRASERNMAGNDNAPGGFVDRIDRKQLFGRGDGERCIERAGGAIGKGAFGH